MKIWVETLALTKTFSDTSSLIHIVMELCFFKEKHGQNGKIICSYNFHILCLAEMIGILLSVYMFSAVKLKVKPKYGRIQTAQGSTIPCDNILISLCMLSVAAHCD